MTLKHEAAQQARERLLAAARETIAGHGLGGLTLDAVARAAGMSKGGLLHHYRSKDALVEAVLRQLLADFEACVERYYAAEAASPPRAGRWLRAYVRASFEDEGPPMELLLTLMNALSEQAGLLTLLHDDMNRWQDRLSKDGVPAARATIIRQAADAAWLDRLTGVQPTPELRRDVLAELLRLTEAAE